MTEHFAQQVPYHQPSAPGLPPEHAPAVHAYANAFCARPRDATDLAVQVLAGGSRQHGPALRTALLADVRRTADSWLRDGRHGLLRPEFRDWSKRAADTFGPVDTLDRVERGSGLLAAFEQLPDQQRAALWLCLAEPEETASAARILSTTTEFAESLAQSARSRLVDTFLRVRAARTADPQCLRYGAMLGAIARGTHREAPADLQQHLDTCRFCAVDLELLRTLAAGDAEEVRRLLVDEVLVWGGAAYREARSEGRAPSGEPVTPAVPSAPPASAGGRGHRAEGRRRRRPVLTVAVTVAVTAALTTGVLRLLSGADSAVGAESPRATASASIAPSSVSDATATTITLENVSTGRCVTGPAKNASPGSAPAADPVLAACDGGRTQEWQVVPLTEGAVALVNADSRFCLDIAGDRVAGDGMQQRPCAYEQGAAAPFPEDQAFLPRAAADDSFVLVCQDNPEIALGVRAGQLAMRTTTLTGKAVRFAADDRAATALGL
ncbi:RICIN domain-containing protein [Streptomyces sp. WI04-05B]|uniref:RICIN domain-containing protein n=1 Tax=Streptomyces TaxID=1883 RepID=UPI0029AA91D1|nr:MULTISPECIES: RICIN domain-containing protein [unclassified Streptomyces]MDX2543835.1 RICIN domain-containing protein [Streptomyces sp. WI04-05B]MDX2582075.1 RICIN domain-containing protein [Streptomyces sp. WI04-05A]MDX3752487.1 RICIN domain-containing protein [Streptomyces sp. AK08-02]